MKARLTSKQGLLIVGSLGLATAMFAYSLAYTCSFAQIDYVLSPRELKDPARRKSVQRAAEKEMLRFARPFIAFGVLTSATSFGLLALLVLVPPRSSRQDGPTDAISGTGTTGGSAPSAARTRKAT